MDDPITIAEEAFLKGFNCSQAVALACAPSTGIPKEVLLSATRGFGAGMGRTQEVCGAVSGGIMALGLHLGQTLGDETQKKQKTYLAVQELMASFATSCVSYNCKELLQG